ncbi:MAG: hypothetical protein IKE94_02185 [Aeriscardovia sp.]|nr:hypothetical protein [Aeriscardovia sp.]MBR3463017.1 hypothetical protein [Clostridiales bacterium]
MDDNFKPEEKLYRAVYPPELVSMFWRKDGTISSAAFADAKGLSVERGYYRQDETVIISMLNRFSGIIVSVSVRDCNSIQATVCYLPSKTNLYHSEIHGSNTIPLLSKSQRLYLAKHAIILR